MHYELLKLMDEITDYAGTRDEPMAPLLAAAHLLKKERDQNALWRARFDAEVKRAVSGLRICHD